jgi:hypothetical protein
MTASSTTLSINEQVIDLKTRQDFLIKQQNAKLTKVQSVYSQLQENPYTKPHLLAAARKNAEDFKIMINSYNAHVATLKQYQLTHPDFLQGEELLNTFYLPDTFYFASGSHNLCKHQNGKFLKNNLFKLLENLAELTTTLENSRMYNVGREVLENGLRLTVDVLKQQERCYEKSYWPRELLYSKELGLIADTIKAVTVFINTPIDEQNFRNLQKCVTTMENRIENPLERFARKKPALAGFLSAVGMLIGVGIIVASAIILSAVGPAAPLAAVATLLLFAGACLFTASFICLTIPPLTKCDHPKDVKLRNQTVEHNELTAISIRSLLASQAPLFNKPKKPPADTATNNMVSRTRDGLLI